ncbi:type IV conjugative transfer system lipoprotein TraV [Rheinheimera hassiensis]|uniref:type IV conjugative transfer system lipoprotein TraV n=1 Tax=Rheinheimera hassiensis TaxID=1193627 RepID=UPI001F05DA13|nr:type IV conjugative transfer system lipoprotein TraV [Rheinheimera hassiensis]
MKKILFVIAASLLLSACMTPIGKEEFTCPNKKKGGVCAGVREIYELTNNRENLNDLSSEQSSESEKVKSGTSNAKGSSKTNDGVVVYEARQHSQHSSSGYQPATVIQHDEVQHASRDSFDAFPGNGEPLAPEPLAIINPAKVMRILIASYTDEKGRLNMPGYVYVQVNEQTFSVGEAANMRPTRVVPLEVRNITQEEMKKQVQRTKGVSPLEAITGGQ